MRIAPDQFGPNLSDSTATYVEPVVTDSQLHSPLGSANFGYGRELNEPTAVHSHEPKVAPAVGEFAERNAHEVVGRAGHESGVVAGRFCVADLVAWDESGDSAQGDRDRREGWVGERRQGGHVGTVPEGGAVAIWVGCIGSGGGTE